MLLLNCLVLESNAAKHSCFDPSGSEDRKDSPINSESSNTWTQTFEGSFSLDHPLNLFWSILVQKQCLETIDLSK